MCYIGAGHNRIRTSVYNSILVKNYKRINDTYLKVKFRSIKEAHNSKE